MSEARYTLAGYNRLATLALAAFDYVNATGPSDQDDANTTALNLAVEPGEYERWSDLVSKIEAGLIVKLYQAVKYLEVTMSEQRTEYDAGSAARPDDAKIEQVAEGYQDLIDQGDLLPSQSYGGEILNEMNDDAIRAVYRLLMEMRQFSAADWLKLYAQRVAQIDLEQELLTSQADPDRARRDEIWQLMPVLDKLIKQEDRPAALYGAVRNELKDAAECLARATGLYLEAIGERGEEAGEE